MIIVPSWCCFKKYVKDCKVHEYQLKNVILSPSFDCLRSSRIFWSNFSALRALTRIPHQTTLKAIVVNATSTLQVTGEQWSLQHSWLLPGGRVCVPGFNDRNMLGQWVILVRVSSSTGVMPSVHCISKIRDGIMLWRRVREFSLEEQNSLFSLFLWAKVKVFEVCSVTECQSRPWCSSDQRPLGCGLHLKIGPGALLRVGNREWGWLGALGVGGGFFYTLIPIQGYI